MQQLKPVDPNGDARELKNEESLLRYAF